MTGAQSFSHFFQDVVFASLSVEGSELSLLLGRDRRPSAPSVVVEVELPNWPFCARYAVDCKQSFFTVAESKEHFLAKDNCYNLEAGDSGAPKSSFVHFVRKSSFQLKVN